MQKRAFIVHGWGGYPTEAWFPWLKAELEARGFNVQSLSMPHPNEPTISEWVEYLAAAVGEPDEDTYLIGHSIGCQTILRYLASLNHKHVGGVVLVAGFFDLPELETDEEKAIARPWLETPINFQNILAATKHITVILSDNDPDVPLTPTRQQFEQMLAAEVIVEHQKGHYSEDSGVKELPAALHAILAYAEK